MPLMFHLRGHVEVVLAEAMGVARGKLLTEVKASLRTEDPDESDDSLCRDEPLHVKWTTLQKCWTLLEAKRGQNGLPQHLHEVIASTAVYHRDPSVRWRLENPDRKKDYKSNKDMRKHAEKKEYSRMVSNVDASQMERERFVATMKYVIKTILPTSIFFPLQRGYDHADGLFDDPSCLRSCRLCCCEALCSGALGMGIVCPSIFLFFCFFPST